LIGNPESFKNGGNETFYNHQYFVQLDYEEVGVISVSQTNWYTRNLLLISTQENL
jgi:hypothetical protein